MEFWLFYQSGPPFSCNVIPTLLAKSLDPGALRELWECWNFEALCLAFCLDIKWVKSERSFPLLSLYFWKWADTGKMRQLTCWGEISLPKNRLDIVHSVYCECICIPVVTFIAVQLRTCEWSLGSAKCVLPHLAELFWCERNFQSGNNSFWSNFFINCIWK